MYLIEILHQTTTAPVQKFNAVKLYLIEILHQTTTGGRKVFERTWLYLIEILHQTTTLRPFLLPVTGCILSKFYIKPQQSAFDCDVSLSCILSKFYIKPQQGSIMKYKNYSCILSKFYIKPQPLAAGCIKLKVVSYRNSTSNHNKAGRE